MHQEVHGRAPSAAVPFWCKKCQFQLNLLRRPVCPSKPSRLTTWRSYWASLLPRSEAISVGVRRGFLPQSAFLAAAKLFGLRQPFLRGFTTMKQLAAPSRGRQPAAEVGPPRQSSCAVRALLQVELRYDGNQSKYRRGRSRQGQA